MLSLCFVVVLALLGACNAYSTGAPASSPMDAMNNRCTSGSIRPGHRVDGNKVPKQDPKKPAILPQHKPGPFDLTVTNGNRPYGPGSALRVKLISTDPRVKFKGFFISADAEDAVTGLKGTFRSVTGYNSKPVSYCAPGITHTGPGLKSQTEVEWVAPTNFTHGRMQFKATVVVNFNTFYTNILSNVVEANPRVMKETEMREQEFQRRMEQANQMMSQFGIGGAGGLDMAAFQKQMQQAVGNFQQAMGGAGGGGAGGLNLQELTRQFQQNMPGATGNQQRNNRPAGNANPFGMDFGALTSQFGMQQQQQAPAANTNTGMNFNFGDLSRQFQQLGNGGNPFTG